MNSLLGLKFDPDISARLVSPIVGVFVSPDIDLSESHIQCIADAVEEARHIIYNSGYNLE